MRFSKQNRFVSKSNQREMREREKEREGTRKGYLNYNDMLKKDEVPLASDDKTEKKHLPLPLKKKKREKESNERTTKNNSNELFKTTTQIFGHP